VQLLKEKLEVERKDMEDACDRIRLAFEQKCVLHLPHLAFLRSKSDTYAQNKPVLHMSP
jgi:hypothetical protein